MFFFFFCLRLHRSHNAETTRPLSVVLHVFRANGPTPDHRGHPVAVPKTVGPDRRGHGDHDRSPPGSSGHLSPVVRVQRKGKSSASMTAPCMGLFFQITGSFVVNRLGNYRSKTAVHSSSAVPSFGIVFKNLPP